MSEFNPGEVVGERYRITGTLGAGGFGDVYAASNLRTGQACALKILGFDKQGSYSPATLARFRRELKALTQLRHANIVALLDHGTLADGRVFAAFELLEGRDLDQVLRSGPLSPAITTHITVQLVNALDAAHRVNLLHRDIKPSNIRVFERDGDPWAVKLLDFGLARTTDDGRTMVTTDGELLGTPRYMSPEQLTSKTLTPASDVYSLGLVMFEMVMGSDALAGNSLGEQFDRLRTGHVFPALDSTPLHQLIVQMTNRDPAARPSLGAVRATLMPQSVAPAQHAAQPRSPNLPVIFAAAIALMLGIAAAVYTLVKPDERTPVSIQQAPPSALLKAPQIADAGPTEAEPDEGVVTPVVCRRTAPFTGVGRLRSGLGAGWTTYIPETYDPGRPSPMLVLLHGEAELGKMMLEYSGYQELAEEHRLVIIAPDADHFLGKFEDPHEEARVFGMQDETALQLCIDRERIFVIGQEYGGLLAEKLACSSWAAAVAMNGAAWFRIYEECKNPKPILRVVPLKSPRIPFDGGPNCNNRVKPKQTNVDERFRTHFQCDPDPKTTFEHKNGECVEYQNCSSRYARCNVNGGDPWPGTLGNTGPVSCPGKAADFPTRDVIWSFFEEESRKIVERRSASE